ncbi:hypothetical protein J3R30DRAFT_3523242 [Lentinula aciculospora]|uniref:receptor protein-tyrosine kinase n=1 Tax=Lentinula aciculospora TaxID=153920 RepID=A0A9W9A271_9AGAR|nr:hypothetical protein J3R30DRAFT_3523242 [Lentinula aciculospora]
MLRLLELAMSSNASWCLALPLFLLTLLSQHVPSQVSCLSIAIPSDTITDIAFDVFWIRDSTDPTVFSLTREWMRPSTGAFEGGGIFANVSGTQGESLDSQSVTLSVTEFGTFIMYGLVLESTTTSTFYTSPSFTVLSPSQASQTALTTTEVVYLGTSFSVPPISSSTTATSSSSSVTATIGVSNPSVSADSAVSSASSHSSNTPAIAGGVVGGVLCVLIVGGTLLFLCRRQRSKDETNDIPKDTAITPSTTQVPHSWLFNSTPNAAIEPFHPSSYTPALPRSGYATNTTSHVKSSVYSPSRSSIDFRGSIMAQYYGSGAPPSSMAASSTIDQYVVAAEAPPSYDQPHFVLTPTLARSQYEASCRDTVASYLEGRRCT